MLFSALTNVIIRLVRARIRRLLAVLLFTICVGAPALEMFDRWDHTLQNGNDTETNLVISALCVASGFLAATALLRRVRPSRTNVFPLPSRCSHVACTAIRQLLPALDAASPPTALRI